MLLVTYQVNGGLFTLNDYSNSCSLDHIFKSSSCLPIPEFSGSPSIYKLFQYIMVDAGVQGRQRGGGQGVVEFDKGKSKEEIGDNNIS